MTETPTTERAVERRPTPRPGTADWTRTAGSTGLTVSAIGLGGAPLASMPEVLGYEVSAEQAIDVAGAALTSPIGVIDTSNGYNDGESERRIGAALAALGPHGTLIVTKVDAKDGDYSGDRVRRSVEESMERLGLPFLPLVHLHDPEFFGFDHIAGPGGAVDALTQLRAEGVIGAIGVAGGHAPTMKRYVDLEVFDALLVHNRLTLVDRSAESVMRQAHERGMAVFNAAIFGGGLLAAPRAGGTTYAYRPASDAVRGAVSALADLCDEFGVELRDVALHHALAEPLVHCTLVGTSRPERIASTLAALDHTIPQGVWDRIDELRPAPNEWLDASN